MKNKAIFLIYLAVSLMVFANPAMALTPDVSVSKATGDLSVNIPLVSIQSENKNLVSDINLMYAGGDGISVGTVPSEVGYGWAISTPSITRMVMGVPDDLNVRSKNTANLTFKGIADQSATGGHVDHFDCPNDLSGSWQHQDIGYPLYESTLICSDFNQTEYYSQLSGILETHVRDGPFSVNVEKNSQVNFWQYLNEDTRVPKIPWWQKAILFVVSIAIVIGGILLAPATGGMSGYATVFVQTMWSLLVSAVFITVLAAINAVGGFGAMNLDMNQMAKDQFSFGWKDGLKLAMVFIPGDLEGLASKVGDVSKWVGDQKIAQFAAVAGTANKAQSALRSGGNQLLTSRPLIDNQSIRYSTHGSFYTEFPYRDSLLINSLYDYSNISFKETDFGQPDVFSANGPYNGPLIPGSEIRETKDGKFVIDIPSKNDWTLHPEYNSLAELSDLDTIAKVEVKTDLFKMTNGVGGPTTDCINAFDSDFCTDERNHFIEDYIDQIIITAPNGQKAIYGHPGVEGSIVRNHRSGQSTYTGVVVGSDDGSYHQRKTNYEFTSHPVEWKLVAVLDANYDGPDYPLDNSDDLKGDWIAYTYEYKFNMKTPNSQCAFVEGSDAPMTDLWEYYGDHPEDTEQAVKRTWTSNIRDISHISTIETNNMKIEYDYSTRQDKRSSRPWNGGEASFNQQYPWFCNADSEGNYCAQYPELGFTARRFNLAFDFTDRSARDNPIFTDLWNPSEAGGNLERLQGCDVDDMTKYDGNNNLDYKLDELKITDKINNVVTRKIKFNYNYDLMKGYRAVPFDPNYDNVTGSLTLQSVQNCNILKGKEVCERPLEFNYNNLNPTGEFAGGIIQ